MEGCGFQSQLLSVVEVLAQAAVAEMDRRVEEGCAVLRVEVSHSRRDIELLKRKLDLMEAALRRTRTRTRARRRALHPAAADRFPPLVKVVLNKDRGDGSWDSPVDSGTPGQTPQSTDTEPAAADDHVLIKEENAEEEPWRNDGEDKLSDFSEAEQLADFSASPPVMADGFAEHYGAAAETPSDPEGLASPAEAFHAFPEERRGGEAELVVKLETEDKPGENAAPLEAGRFVTEEDDAHMWMSGLCRDAAGPSGCYAAPHFQQVPAVFAPQSALLAEDGAGPRKSQSVLMTAARVKRRARTFACRRAPPEEGLGALSLMNCGDPGPVPPQSSSHLALPPQDPAAPGPAHPYGHGRPGFGLARRMRTPWRSGLGEKRFGCSFCDKTFMRFSQLKEHLRSHTGEKPFSCAQCGRCFTKQCNLIRHAVVHSGEKPHHCAMCGKCFTQRSSLKSHQKTAH